MLAIFYNIYFMKFYFIRLSMQLCFYMAETSIKQKKEWAKTLYVKERLSQKEIAVKVGASEKSISKWKEDGKWDTLRVSVIITKDQQLSRLYAQINELNTTIESREEGKRYANSKEADTLVKLTAAAKSLENDTGISETISVFMKFNDWLRPLDLDAAQEQIKLQDQFITTLLK